jgi:restriction endonuclease S subunit
MNNTPSNKIQCGKSKDCAENANIKVLIGSFKIKDTETFLYYYICTNHFKQNKK